MLLTILHTKRDSSGNVYYALRLSNYGRDILVGTIAADNIDIEWCHNNFVEVVYDEILPRTYKTITTNWDYLGCRWEEIKDKLLATSY